MRHRLLMYLGAACFGFSPILVRIAEVPGTVAALYRVSISAALLTIPLLVSMLRFGMPLSRGGAALAIIGGLLFAGNISLFYESIDLTTVANASFLANTSVIWVGLATWLLKRKALPVRFWVGAGVSLAGIYLISFQGPTLPEFRLGDFLAFAASLFYAAYIIVNHFGRIAVGTIGYVWLFCLSSSFGLLVLCFASQQVPWGFGLSSYVILIALAIVSQVIGFWSITYSQAFIAPSETSSALLLEPVVSLLLAGIILREQPTAPQFGGMMTLLMGIFLASRTSPRLS